MSIDRALETGQGLLLLWAWLVIHNHTKRLDNLEQRKEKP